MLFAASAEKAAETATACSARRVRTHSRRCISANYGIANVAAGAASIHVVIRNVAGVPVTALLIGQLAILLVGDHVPFVNTIAVLGSAMAARGERKRRGGKESERDVRGAFHATAEV